MNETCSADEVNEVQVNETCSDNKVNETCSENKVAETSCDDEVSEAYSENCVSTIDHEVTCSDENKYKQTRAGMEIANTCKVAMKKSKVKNEKDQYKTKIHATMKWMGILIQ